MIAPRCVADLQAPVVKVLLEGLYDKACFFSWFRGHIGGHKVMGMILKHLRRHWERLASSGWSLEDFARYTICLLPIIVPEFAESIASGLMDAWI